MNLWSLKILFNQFKLHRLKLMMKLISEKSSSRNLETIFENHPSTICLEPWKPQIFWINSCCKKSNNVSKLPDLSRLFYRGFPSDRKFPLQKLYCNFVREKYSIIFFLWKKWTQNRWILCTESDKLFNIKQSLRKIVCSTFRSLQAH